MKHYEIDPVRSFLIALPVRSRVKLACAISLDSGHRLPALDGGGHGFSSSPPCWSCSRECRWDICGRTLLWRSVYRGAVAGVAVHLRTVQRRRAGHAHPGLRSGTHGGHLHHPAVRPPQTLRWFRMPKLLVHHDVAYRFIFVLTTRWTG